MAQNDPAISKQFAIEVVKRLRNRGFEAFWAGGCVRDRLLGRTAKDYDVATNASPQQTREVFGSRRTLDIGAAFGVIVVLGPGGSEPVEVTTFRSDASYSDGRHPDEVYFSTAEEDAQRRDFTINGVFYDPLNGKYRDFVNGIHDLEIGVIRAIGDANARFGEDKLRMLRAVRFAATFAFHIDDATFSAVRSRASEITQVSAERIGAELRLMLVHDNRAKAVQLLSSSGLLKAILPEVDCLGVIADAAGQSAHLEPLDEASDNSNPRWQHTLNALACLSEPNFPVAAAVVLREIYRTLDNADHATRGICRRWKLSNDETDRIGWLLQHEGRIRTASNLRWPTLQRLLIHKGIDDLLCLSKAVAQATGDTIQHIELCRSKLDLPSDVLNPKPLLTGHDLISHGIAPGKLYSHLLVAVRDAQLEQTIVDKKQALALVDELWQKFKD